MGTWYKEGKAAYERCVVKSAILWTTETSCHRRSWGNSVGRTSTVVRELGFLYTFPSLICWASSWGTFNARALLTCAIRTVYLKCLQSQRFRNRHLKSSAEHWHNRVLARQMMYLRPGAKWKGNLREKHAGYCWLPFPLETEYVLQSVEGWI